MENTEEMPLGPRLKRGQGAEKDVIKGHAGQLANLNIYCIGIPIIIAALYSLLLIPDANTRLMILGVAGFIAAYLAWQYLVIRMYRFRLTSERLYLQRGVLNIRTDQVELYRVKDVTVFEPIAYRMFGQGNILMATSDRSTPQVLLFAISTPHETGQAIRSAVEKARMLTGTRELD